MTLTRSTPRADMVTARRLAGGLALALLLTSPLAANEPPAPAAAPVGSVTSAPLPELPQVAPAAGFQAPATTTPELPAVMPSTEQAPATDQPAESTEAQPTQVMPMPPANESAQDQATEQPPAEEQDSSDEMLNQARDAANKAWESVKQGTADAVEVGKQVAGKVWEKAKEIAGDITE